MSDFAVFPKDMSAEDRASFKDKAKRFDRERELKLELDIAKAKIARLERLCQTHGLWIDG